MTATNHEKYRPPAEERWTDGIRTEPVRIAVRTEWLYSEYNPKTLLPEGRTRHPFSRSGRVTASDVPSDYAHMQDVAAHLYRAVAAFGDDKDLVIEVRLAGDGTAVPKKAERPATPGPEVVPSEYRVLPTGYRKSPLTGKQHFELRVCWRGAGLETGEDRWAVVHTGSCLAADGTWEHELLPSSRDDDWLARHRFTREEALRLAASSVDDVVINGRTLAQWEQHFASRSEG
ncbi:hypothetical protein [Streptomyces brevispora]|uniref:hypothetical protein n=1 Tax=Streptomyces brevispora TaxID=887462 RepID=UPI0038259076